MNEIKSVFCEPYFKPFIEYCKARNYKKLKDIINIKFSTYEKDKKLKPFVKNIKKRLYKELSKDVEAYLYSSMENIKHSHEYLPLRIVFNENKYLKIIEHLNKNLNCYSLYEISKIDLNNLDEIP
jgi:hypothetical protein